MANHPDSWTEWSKVPILCDSNTNNWRVVASIAFTIAMLSGDSKVQPYKSKDHGASSVSECSYKLLNIHHGIWCFTFLFRGAEIRIFVFPTRLTVRRSHARKILIEMLPLASQSGWEVKNNRSSHAQVHDSVHISVQEKRRRYIHAMLVPPGARLVYESQKKSELAQERGKD